MNRSLSGRAFPTFSARKATAAQAPEQQGLGFAATHPG